eukprot:TRINITY_DN4281_c1_g1_i2.p1 TRINITY_DN4281_c1_g1~~TRINITY_DN4281_c1_g1_i2.p1  ORF type:complete len:564 (+),score=122.52 TRINITY_DN4281_c1_g1_i2:17-1708(+)
MYSLRILSRGPISAGAGPKTIRRYFTSGNPPIAIPSLELFQRASKHDQKKTAIISTQGSFSYSNLLKDSEALSKQISSELAKSDVPESELHGKRISVLCQNGYDYVRAQWAVWHAGGVFVPLCTTHPPSEMEYFIKDSTSSLAICDDHFERTLSPLAKKLNIPCITLPKEHSEAISSRDVPTYNTFAMDHRKPAMIIYTSGTTGKPKGVVTSHANIEAQVKTMIEPWGWNKDDKILHVLPLHHVHGVVNVLTCPLWAGATCDILPKFDARAVWDRFINDKELTLFMAVPTVYAKLIHHYEHDMSDEERRKGTEGCKRLRLMVSGSAALPESIMSKWREISGHTLLERYGMTEIGMALSNPLKGERIGGTVGFPLPSVEARIVNETTEENLPPGQSGELRIKGPSVFSQYWNREKATAETFDKEGWFKTGDIAVNNAGRYTILGRASVDIIKSAGFKISALDIEREILEHPTISECAVIGMPNDEYGQIIGVILANKKNAKPITLEQLTEFLKTKLAGYKMPRVLLTADALPRNAMGKTNKKELVKLFDSVPAGWTLEKKESRK